MFAEMLRNEIPGGKSLGKYSLHRRSSPLYTCRPVCEHKHGNNNLSPLDAHIPVSVARAILNTRSVRASCLLSKPK